MRKKGSGNSVIKKSGPSEKEGYGARGPILGVPVQNVITDVKGVITNQEKDRERGQAGG